MNRFREYREVIRGFEQRNNMILTKFCHVHSACCVHRKPQEEKGGSQKTGKLGDTDQEREPVVAWVVALQPGVHVWLRTLFEHPGEQGH